MARRWENSAKRLKGLIPQTPSRQMIQRALDRDIPTLDNDLSANELKEEIRRAVRFTRQKLHPLR